MTDDPTANADLVAKLDVLAEKASPRPWFNGSWSGMCHLPHFPHGQGKCKYDYTMRPDPRYISSEAGPRELVTADDWGPILSEGDAGFIVALVNSWPQLRAELLAARQLADAAEYTVLAMQWDDTDLCRALAAWRAVRGS